MNGISIMHIPAKNWLKKINKRYGGDRDQKWIKKMQRSGVDLGGRQGGQPGLPSTYSHAHIHAYIRCVYSSIHLQWKSIEVGCYTNLLWHPNTQ